MKKRIVLVGLAILLTACVVLGLSLSQRPTVMALEPTPSSFPVGVWRRCPLPAGQGGVLAIAISPNYAADGTVFIATSTGGVWRSTDFGESWEQASSGLPSLRMNDLVISPNFAADQTLFAATVESQGVYKSQNGGASWASAKGDLPALTPTALAMVADEVFVGTQLSSGKAYLYTSRDGGTTWGKYLELGRGGNITDITLPPEFTLDRTNIWVTSELALLKRKADNTTWVVQYQVGGMFGREWIPKALAASPDDLFVGVYRGILNGDSCVNRSTDGGQHWQRSLTFASEEITYGLVASPNFASDHTVFLGLDWERYLGWSSIQGVRASTDSGATWQAIDQGLADLTIRSLGVAIKDGQFCLFAGTSGGLYRRLPPTTDVRIDAGDVHLVQVVEDANLVKDKATVVRATVKKSGPDAAPGVRLQLKVNGQLLNLPFYHEESATRDNDFTLQDPVTGIYFDAGDQQKTVYFFGDELTPRTVGNYTVEVTAIPHEDKDPSNNTASRTIEASEKTWFEGDSKLKVGFFVADPWMWGAVKPVPLNPWSSSILDHVNGAGRMFNSMFPITSANYEQTLLTYFADSGGGRISDPVAWTEKIYRELREKYEGITDFICLVPSGWLSQKMGIGKAAGITFETALHISVVEVSDGGEWISPHELLHHFGVLWDLPKTNPCPEVTGLDVAKGRRLYTCGGTCWGPHPGGRWVFSLMAYNGCQGKGTDCYVPGLSSFCRVERWVTTDVYTTVLSWKSERRLQTVREVSATRQDILLLSGSVTHDGQVTLSDDWSVVPNGVPDIFGYPEQGDYLLQFLDRGGQVLFEYPFDISFGIFGSDQELNTSGFVFATPYYPETKRVVIKHRGEEVASRTVSEHKPTIRVISPNGGERFTESFPIRWEASDTDGGTLYYDVSISPDGGQTWTGYSPMQIEGQTAFFDLSRYIGPRGANCLIRVRVTDGFNTAEDVSNAPFSILMRQFLPLVIKPAGPVPPTPTPVPIPNDGKIWGKCWEEGTGRIIRGIRMRAGSPDGNETYLEIESDEDGVYKFDFLQRPRPVTEYGIWPTYHPEMRRVVSLTDGNKVVREDFSFPPGTTQ